MNLADIERHIDQRSALPPASFSLGFRWIRAESGEAVELLPYSLLRCESRLRDSNP